MARPLRRMLASRLLWSAAAVAYGAALWVFALYFFAHLVTGNKPLPGLCGITSVALLGGNHLRPCRGLGDGGARRGDELAHDPGSRAPRMIA